VPTAASTATAPEKTSTTSWVLKLVVATPAATIGIENAR